MVCLRRVILLQMVSLVVVLLLQMVVLLLQMVALLQVVVLQMVVLQVEVLQMLPCHLQQQLELEQSSLIGVFPFPAVSALRFLSAVEDLC